MASAGAGADTGASLPDEARKLKRALKGRLKPLVARFSDLGSIDKLALATRQVEDLKASIGRTLTKATERDSLIGELDAKAEAMRDSAKVMFESSGRVRAFALCRHRKVVAAAAACCAIVVAVIVVAINYSTTPHLIWS